MKKLLLPLLVLSLFAPPRRRPRRPRRTASRTRSRPWTRRAAARTRPGPWCSSRFPNGKTLVRIQARGLQSGGEYFLTWSTGTSCALETDNAAKTFEHFKAHPNGNLNVTARLETDLTSIGSLGIRTETGQVLVACAASTP